MKRFAFFSSTVNIWTGKVARYLVLAMLGMLLYEVIARYVFNSPTMWTHETTTMTLGVYMVIGGGYCILTGSHLKIDFIWSRLRQRHQAILDVVTFGFSLIFLIALAWYSIEMAWEATLRQERSITAFNPPTYPLNIIIAIAVILVFMQAIVKFIHDLHIAITGETRG